MKKEQILEAKEEAKRFLKKVEEYEKVNGGLNEKTIYPAPMKERSAIKRASMDLSRVLSKMRNTKLY